MTFERGFPNTNIVWSQLAFRYSFSLVVILSIDENIL